MAIEKYLAFIFSYQLYLYPLKTHLFRLIGKTMQKLTQPFGFGMLEEFLRLPFLYDLSAVNKDHTVCRCSGEFLPAD